MLMQVGQDKAAELDVEGARGAWGLCTVPNRTNHLVRSETL